MRIALSFCADGMGHAARAAALAESLEKEHQLYFFCPRSIHAYFKSIYPKARLYDVPLIKQIKRKHRLLLLPTAARNFRRLFFSTHHIRALKRNMYELNIDMVISDYEPFAPLAAKKLGIPVILLNNQHVLSRYNRWNLSAIALRISNWVMMPAYNKIIVTSFFSGDVGPLVRKEIRNAKVSDKGFYVAYIKESMADVMRPALHYFPNTRFRIFPSKKGNWVSSLASCRAVIGPGGHQLMGECLHLKKPLLALPEEGQYEQQLNAEMLQRSGRGMICDHEDIEGSIKNFMDSIKDFPWPMKAKGTHFVLHDDTGATIKLIKQYLKDVVYLEQRPNDFTTKSMHLKPGEYIFVVKNKDADRTVNFVLKKDDKKVTKIRRISQGKSRVVTVDLQRGTYSYYSSKNDTPEYRIVVG